VHLSVPHYCCNNAISLTTLQFITATEMDCTLCSKNWIFVYTLHKFQSSKVWCGWESDLGLSPWKPRFNPGLVHVRFVVYSVTGTTGCVDEVQLSPVNITAPLVHTHHLYTTLTRKMSRWNPGTFKPKYWGAMDGKVLSYCNADFKG